MTGHEGGKDNAERARHGLTVIAAWQFATFLLLLLLVWAKEIFDLPAILYGRAPAPPDYFSASLVTAFIALAAIVAIGQTYLKQQAILHGFLTVCSRCHKVRVRKNAWQSIEQYVAKRSDVEFSHGLCPDCFREEMEEIGDQE